MQDLRPWICCQVACPCSRTPYTARDGWVEHLKALHEVHPDWDDKTCPFCPKQVASGGLEMIRHVEHHLQEISLAALGGPSDEEEDDYYEEEEQSEVAEPLSKLPSGQDPPDTPAVVVIEALEDHPVHRSAKQCADGLWHCPWNGEDYCNHAPTMDKSEFEYVRDHKLGRGRLTDFFAVSTPASTSKNSVARLPAAREQPRPLPQWSLFVCTNRRPMTCTSLALATTPARARGAAAREKGTGSRTPGCGISTSRKSMGTWTFRTWTWINIIPRGRRRERGA